MRFFAHLFTLLIVNTLPAQKILPGDIAVLGVVANNFACTGVSGGDEVSFVCFKDIPPGTTFDLTDNGWERCQTNRWGESEGTIRFTRTGATIPAGTILTYQLTSSANFGTYKFISPDDDWTVQNLNTGFAQGMAVNLNAGGDQLFFLAGGNWQNFGTTNDNDAEYSGDVLFGFNSKSVWQASCANSPTQNSNLPPEIVPCFKMEPTGASDFSKYTGQITPTTQLEWIDRIRNRNNWTFFSDCQTYNSAAPGYANGLKFNVLSTQFGITGGPNGVCFGDTANLSLTLPSVGQPFKIGWTDGQNQFSATGISQGDFLPVVPPASAIFQINLLSDANGCVVQSGLNGTFFLEVFKNDSVFLTEKTCKPSEVGNFQENWTNKNGCDSLVFRAVSFDSVACAVDFSFFKKDISCFGKLDGAIYFAPTSGAQPFGFQLNNLQTGQSWVGQLSQIGDTVFLQNLAAGSFVLQISDANGVSKTTNFSISEPPILTGQLKILSDFNGFAVRCFGDKNGKVLAEIAGGTKPYSFKWSNGENAGIAEILPAGEVKVSVTDVRGCSLEFSENLTAPDSLIVNFEVAGETCFGKKNGEIHVISTANGAAPFQFSFENAPFSSQTDWENLPPGYFQIEARDANNCTQKYAATLPEGPGFQFSAGADTCIFSGDSLRWNPISSRQIDTLIFTPKQFSVFEKSQGGGWFFPKYDTQFSVFAIDVSGCVAMDTFQICVEKERSIFVPNIFSPTSEKIENQRLIVFADRGVSEILEFQIHDRFGAEVYKSGKFLPNQIDVGWDGKVSGRLAPPGIYAWFGRVKFSDGREKMVEGDVLLVR